MQTLPFVTFAERFYRNVLLILVNCAMTQKEENSSLIYIISLIIFGVEILAANSLSSRSYQTNYRFWLSLQWQQRPRPSIRGTIPPLCRLSADAPQRQRQFGPGGGSLGPPPRWENLMDVASPSEAERRIPQMAEWARMRLPSSIFVSVSLFTAETTAALYLSSTYRFAGDQIWQALTLLFTLIPSVLVQLTLTFIHRDLSRDRPLVLLLHLLQLGPIVRSVCRCLSPRWAHAGQHLLQPLCWFVGFKRKKQTR